MERSLTRKHMTNNCMQHQNLPLGNLKKNNTAMTISVLLIIYLTDSLLFATSTISILTLTRRFLPIVLVVPLMVINHGKIRWSILFTCGSILVSMMLAGRITNGYSYISQIVLLLCAFYYTKMVKYEEFSDCFIKWMRIIAAFSLVCFVFGSAIRSLSIIPTVTNASYNTFKVLFLTNVPESASLARRNWGPFWEPGTFQFYLNLALLMSIFKEGNKHRLLDIGLFITVAFTTLSGAAILPIPFIFMAYLLNNEERMKNKSGKLVVAVAFLVVFLVSIYSGKFDEIFNKLFQVGADSSSMGFRLGSLLANIKAALTHPFFGAAPEVQDAMRTEMIYSLNEVRTNGNTNTVFAIYASYGLFVGTFYFLKLFSFTRVLSYKKIVRIMAFVAILLATSNENLTLSTTFNILLFMGMWKKSVLKTGEEKYEV